MPVGGSAPPVQGGSLREKGSPSSGLLPPRGVRLEISREELLEDFLALLALDSPPGREGPVAAWCATRLEELGARCRLDEAGQIGGSEVGNLHAGLPGPAGRPPLLLVAHMDTVPEAVGVRPVVERGCVRTRGETPLGADDKSGIAVILAALRAWKRASLPWPGLHVLLTIREEDGLVGSRLADLEGLAGGWGYVLDGPSVDRLIHRAPARNRFELQFQGREAHLAREPELGINAAHLAAQAVAAMPLGRVDPWTTVAVDRLVSTAGPCCVPSHALVQGEVGSLDPRRLEHATRAVLQAAQQAAQGNQVVLGGRIWQAGLEARVELLHPGFCLPEDHPGLALALAAARALGRNLQLCAGSGGCDANLLGARGLPCAVLGTGMALCHTPQENIRIDDMVRAAELLTGILAAARGAAARTDQGVERRPVGPIR